VLFQFGLDNRMHELRHIAAQHRDFAHQSRGNKGVLFLRRHEHGFDFRSEVAAHVGQLKFKLEVRDGAQAAHDYGQAVLPRKVDRQTPIAHHLDILHVGKHAAGHVDPLFEGEHRRFVRIGCNRNHQAIENTGRPPHQVVVAIGDGIEGTRIDCCSFMHSLRLGH
jgi:hypothetical protein